MKKKIHIHIGTHKTGTSAIQDFLLLNKKALLRNGVLYPQKSRRDYVDSQDGEIVILPNKYKNYAHLAHLCRRKDKHVILSSETFCLIKNISAMKIALGNANVKIICYLRRQDSVIQSLYNQSVKDGGCYKEITEYHTPFTLDYFELLNRWAAVFGKENIIVRPYEKQQFKDNDLIADFLNIVGLALTDDFKLLEKNANPRLPTETLEYMRLLNSFLRDKTKAKYIKKKLIAYSTEKFKDSTESIFYNHSLLSPDQKLAIIEQYTPSNQRVAQDYLGRENGCLFFEAIAERSPQSPPQTPLSDEIIFDITRSLCRNRKIKKILIRAIGQDFSAMDAFSCDAQEKISGVLNQSRFTGIDFK